MICPKTPQTLPGTKFSMKNRKFIPKECESMARDHLSTKLFLTDLVPRTCCESIVRKFTKERLPKTETDIFLYSGYLIMLLAAIYRDQKVFDLEGPRVCLRGLSVNRKFGLHKEPFEWHLCKYYRIS